MTPTPFLLLLLIPQLWRSPAAAVSFAVACCVLGATAVGHLGSGSPLLLPVAAALPLLWHARRAPPIWPAPARTLAALLLWATLLTLFAPRLLAGTVQVIGVVSLGAIKLTRLVPLEPQAGNVNQLAYLLLAGAVFLAVTRLLADPGTSQLDRRFSDALLLTAGLQVLITLLQVLHLYGGAPNLLEFLVNAGYAVHLGGNIGGLNRLSGTFPEASAYAAFTLTLHAACRALGAAGHRPRLSGALAGLLLLALLACTSSSAYGGLALLYGGQALGGLWRLLQAPAQQRVGLTALAAWLAASVLVLALLVSPALQDMVVKVAQVTLLNKLDSASGVERSQWNAQAWAAFIDSCTLGIGVGSTRASSFPLVALSNIGLIGSALFSLFLLQAVVPALHDPRAGAARLAGAHGVLAALCSSLFSATVLDLGVFFYLLAALAAATGTAAAPAPPATMDASPLGAAHGL